MEFGQATYGLSLLAGMLSILSPCVLPLILILLAMRSIRSNPIVGRPGPPLLG